ncbi:DUF1684 domain-containing protein [Demequina litorisediminis]|uniref:DUF1684 domain-containing protein n=1 Tax=Demequina litorisediminis TaxID=1849022 RepID=A0ABQ6I827_9MICO|nr:DUF1684 domain-containing protein [Demequina litorisediminis]GMA33890.1 hypothetical protein GCM10025876_00940 [Demequina litorisediminis]
MHYSWHVLDWRREVASIYAEVRQTADAAAAHARWCERRAHLLATHPATPVPPAHRASFAPVVAAYDPAWRFEVAVEEAAAERREVPTATDGVVPFERIGRVTLDGLGSLDVWWLDSYGGGVFVPLKDTSPGSYGGGRYVLDTVKGADLGGALDGLVIDLNFAFQPSCAYSSDWVCPLPGPGNRLDVAVDVGERYTPLEA